MITLLDTHPDKEIFYEFAEMVKNDTSFQKSIFNYNGEDLRFFGTITSNETSYFGGSNRTIAYKKVSEFLRDKFSTPLTKNKTFINHENTTTIQKEVAATRDTVRNVGKSGCLIPILIIVLVIITLLLN